MSTPTGSKDDGGDILSWTVRVASSCFLTPVGGSLPLLVLSVFLLTIRRRLVAFVQQRGLRQSGKRPPADPCGGTPIQRQQKHVHVCHVKAPLGYCYLIHSFWGFFGFVFLKK